MVVSRVHVDVLGIVRVGGPLPARHHRVGARRDGMLAGRHQLQRVDALAAHGARGHRHAHYLRIHAIALRNEAGQHGIWPLHVAAAAVLHTNRALSKARQRRQQLLFGARGQWVVLYKARCVRVYVSNIVSRIVAQPTRCG